MKSLLYITCTELPCVGTPSAPIILCISTDIALVSGGNTMEALLVTGTKANDSCAGSAYWRYTVSYDETKLADPATLLVPEDITGIFCETCFTDWIKEYVAKAIADAT